MKHHSFDAKAAALVAQAYHRLTRVRTSLALFVSLTLVLLPASIFLSIRGFPAAAPWLLFFYLACSLLSCFFVRRSVGAVLVAIPIHLLFIAGLTALLGPASSGFLLLYLALWISTLAPSRKKLLTPACVRS